MLASPRSPILPRCSPPWARRSKARAHPSFACRAWTSSTARAIASIPTASRPEPSSSPEPSPAATSVVANCNPAHLGAVIGKLEEAGARIDILGKDSIRVRSEGDLKAADVSTEEYPGFPTDMQAQYMALATQAEGTSVVTENIFENRFMHVQELVRMGANIKVDGRTATIRGKSPLSAAAVMCSDLRASASLVLAAMVADGESILDRVYHMDRGYEHIEEKLRGVGAQIRRMGNVFADKRELATAEASLILGIRVNESFHRQIIRSLCSIPSCCRRDKCPWMTEFYAITCWRFMRGGSAHVDLATVLDDFPEKLQGSRPAERPYYSVAAS